MTIRKKELRIGTRSSRLAGWQADRVAAMLRDRGLEARIAYIETTGDLNRRTDFGALGAKGVFVKELETALLEGRVDLAVHSLKDVPTAMPEGLAIGAVMERESPYDALVTARRRQSGFGASATRRCTLEELPHGARVATGSLRRTAQALALRPDLEIAPLRGNVPTRVEKIRRGQADATLLAVAGLKRLGMENEIDQVFDAERFTPVMGQGAIAVECREGECDEILASLDHETTRAAVEAERLFLARVGGGCKTPVGVFATPTNDSGWKVTAMVASADGRSLVRRSCDVASTDCLNAAALGLAETILDQADGAIMETLHPKLVELRRTE